MTPEQAQDALERFAVSDPDKRLERRVSRLRGRAHAALKEFLDDVGDERLGTTFDRLPDDARRDVFRALHPGLGDLLDTAWTALRTHPFTSGFAARGFRAPSDPQASAGPRARWLLAVLWALHPYEQQDAAWLATWAGRRDTTLAEAELGRLLAVAIDHGDEQVYDILLATVRGDHDIALMGGHVPVALLGCSRPDAWEVVERLLLSAQRQEGLRQSILEAVDLAHPTAFRRMVRLVRDEGLTRFSAVVRAVAVWLGEPFDVTDRKLIDALLDDLLVLLDDESARADALASDDPGKVYLALWSIAFDDAIHAVATAEKTLTSDSADIRLAAARLLADMRLRAAQHALLPALHDPDLRVVAVAVHGQSSPFEYDDAVFTGLCAVLDRLPKKDDVEVGLWRPQRLRLSSADVADGLARAADQRSPDLLADVVPHMSSDGRFWYARRLAKEPKRYRTELLDLVGDRSHQVREAAVRALGRDLALTEQEALNVEALLRRRSGGVRQAALTVLLRQPAAQASDSVRRLRAGDARQAEAGQELADTLRADGKLVKPSAPKPAELIDHTARTPANAPASTTDPFAAWQDGVSLVLTSLDAWLAEHRDVEVTVSHRWGADVRLVGNLTWLHGPRTALPWDEQRDGQPLRELTDPWWERTAPQLTAGGFEVVVAWAAAIANEQPGPFAAEQPRWLRKLLTSIAHRDLVKRLHFAPVVAGMLPWYGIREVRAEWIDLVLDVVAASLAAVPARATSKLPRVSQRGQFVVGRDHSSRGYDWRDVRGVCAWFRVAVDLESLRPELWTPEQRGRLWRIARYVDEPLGTYDPTTGGREPYAQNHWRSNLGETAPRRVARYRPPLRLAVRAADDGHASHADVLEHLIGERADVDIAADDGFLWSGFGELTRRRRPDWVADHPWLTAMVDDVRDRIIDAETKRGELPTVYSQLAGQIQSITGVGTTVRLLAALGAGTFSRGYVWGSGDTKTAMLSRLIRVTFPGDDETPEQFAAAAGERRISERRMLELAVYAPQWAAFVEAVSRPGLTDAVHWIHAHTKDDRWDVAEDVRETWVVETHQRTPLQPSDLVNGAVDVAWLNRVLTTFGDAEFDELLTAGKYASTSGGHKRAELFAQAVRCRLDRAELVERITGKRHQDAVRAFGLLPLPDGPDARTRELLDRYQLLRGWQEGSSKFGQQRRASERLAVRIALENLARTAGYCDPQRLSWAIEAEAVRDLAAGPVTVVDGDLSVSLRLDDGGAPRLDVRRGQRALKSVPKSASKNEGIVALKERVSALRKQRRRMRQSLEDAMLRGDRFTVTELGELLAHPMLAPMVRSLVVVSEEGVHGFPRNPTLVGADGTERPMDGSPLRIAHPVDLLDTGCWPDWQRACFAQRVVQPFKQVFRELYVLTDAERDGATDAERYAGHQINPRQAVALLTGRGWLVSHEEGGAIRTFHDERLTARLDTGSAPFTPSDVEGATIGSVSFTPVGEWRPVPLTEVPARVFSEVMRDVDLVVSVAHMGGADPEASTSTVDMRGTLVRETAELLALDNVEVTDHHVLINGKLGSYSIHLGSGVVHRRPGNAVCIVAVGSQHRGRLFLPFADDDPRTAEVLSKVVLLARDDKISDPTILRQLAT